MQQYGVILTSLVLSRLTPNIQSEWVRHSEDKEDELVFLLDFVNTELRTSGNLLKHRITFHIQTTYKQAETLIDNMQFEKEVECYVCDVERLCDELMNMSRELCCIDANDDLHDDIKMHWIQHRYPKHHTELRS